MSPRWHTLIESGDDFLASASFRYVHAVEVPVSPERTWAALTARDTLVSWTPLVTSLRWISPRPFGVGTTREITLGGLVTFRERYYRWEEGRRKTFTGVATSRSGLRRLAEDYLVEPVPAGSRFTWTIAVEPSPALAPALRLASPITSLVTWRMAHGLRSHVG